MTVLRVNTIAGIGTTTFGPTFGGNLEFNSQNYIVLPKGSSTQQGVLRETVDVVGTGGTFYDNLVLAMPFNQATGLRDVSSRNRNPGVYGNVAINTAQSKYYGSSAYFDGASTSFITTENNLSDFNFGSLDFTIEFWIQSTKTDRQDPVQWNYSFSNSGWAGFVFNLNASGEMAWYEGVNSRISASSTGWNNGSWNHISVCRSGNSVRMFLNGTQVGSTYTTSLSYGADNSGIRIGNNFGGPTTTTTQGYIQDLRIYKGIAKYTANFTPPDRIAEIGVGFTAGQLRYNTDSNLPELYDGNQWVQLSVSQVGLGTGGDTEPGARGLWGGGRVGPALQTIIDYINISSTGNAVNFGNLTQARRRVSACASSTRGVWGGGYDPDRSTIDFVTISSTGTAASFGSLTTSRRTPGSLSNSTRGIWAGGTTTGPAIQNIIDYITIATTGNAIDFGDLTVSRDGPQGCSSPVRGVFGGGYLSPTGNNSNVIDYITISTLGNATDFGDLTTTARNCTSCSNPIRGLFGGGYTPTAVNTIQYVTIASLGNAVRFGDLTRVGGPMQAVSSPIRGVWGGGYVAPSETNIIDYVIIPTQGNAVDFGDLFTGRAAGGGCSNAHGGL